MSAARYSMSSGACRTCEMLLVDQYHPIRAIFDMPLGERVLGRGEVCLVTRVDVSMRRLLVRTLVAV